MESLWKETGKGNELWSWVLQSLNQPQATKALQDAAAGWRANYPQLPSLPQRIRKLIVLSLQSDAYRFGVFRQSAYFWQAVFV